MKTLRELFGIDVRSLALFRVCVGLVILYDVASRLPDLAAFYTDAGLLPRLSLLNKMANPWALSVHLMSGAAFVQAFLLLIQGVCGIGLLVGYRTRWMAVLAWWLTASLHRRNPMVAGGGDDYFRLLLFWGMFLPMGARWSLDRALSPARRPPPARAFSWGTAALLLQVAMGYLMAVYHKWDLPMWHDGTAIYYALSIDNYANAFAPVLLGFPSLLKGLTHATLWFEWFGTLLLFCPLFTGPVRTLAVCVFLFMHAGFSASLHLMLFPAVSATAMLPFLPSWFWDRLVFRRPPRPVPPAEARPIGIASSAWANGCAAVFLACAVSWNLQAVKPLHYKMPEALRVLTNLTHLEQAWRMFAPPPPTGGWFVIPGTLKDGTEVDLFRRGAPVSWEKPSRRAMFRNERWRRYMFNFVFGKNKAFWPDYAQYLCRSWNDGHAGLQQLQSLEIVFMARTTPPPGQAAAYQKKVLLAQSCASTGPRQDTRSAPARAFGGPRAPRLDADTRAYLLAQALASIRGALDGAPAARVVAPSERPALNQPTGVFVTLTQNGRLRGCRGTTTTSRPLLEGVTRFAREAAVNDPRFPPLTKRELGEVRIKISVLSSPTPVSSAEQIVPGTHGVTVSKDGHRGLFLPSVWKKLPEKGRFLSELCAKKAELPVDCWKDPQTELSVFTATDFEN